MNDDFSYVGKDGKTYSLTLKEKLFCEEYLSTLGNGIEAMVNAGYDVYYKDKKGESTETVNRPLAAAMASEYLRKPNVYAFVNSLLEKFGFSDDNVEKQHLFLINQFGDLTNKAKALDMFYKLKNKYPATKYDVQSGGKPFSILPLVNGVLPDNSNNSNKSASEENTSNSGGD